MRTDKHRIEFTSENGLIELLIKVFKYSIKTSLFYESY